MVSPAGAGKGGGINGDDAAAAAAADADADAALPLLDRATAASLHASPPSPLRWLVLLTFSLVSAQQQMGWVLPGAIQPNFVAVYGVDEDTIQLLENYGTIFFIVFALPSAWALDRLGCRVPVLACCALMLACSVLRVLARDSAPGSLALVHLAMILDAVVGPVVMAAPSKLAADWFPPAERTVATALAALSNQSGSIVVYVLVPLLCPDASEAGMRRLNLVLLGVSVLNCALAALYFPSLPPHAPSASAALERADGSAERITLRSLFGAWRAFARDASYVCIMVSYSLVAGFANPQGSLLEPGLAGLGASEGAAGWVNAAAQLASLVVGVGVSAGVDALKRRARWLHKAALVGSVAAAGVTYLLYAAAFAPPVTAALGSLALPVAAASFCAANGFIGAAIPLWFDSAAERAFGKGPDGAMLMGLVLPLNVVTLAVLFAPASSFFAWINYGVAAVTLASAVALQLVVPSTLQRFDFDMEAAALEGGSDDSVAAKALEEAA